MVLFERAAVQVPVEAISPFRGIPGSRGQALGFDYALPVDRFSQHDAGLPDAIRRLRARYRQLRCPLRIEFNAEIWPGLGPALEGEGLQLESRNPLMTCTASQFAAMAMPEVQVRFLDPDARHPSTHRVQGEIDGTIVGRASIGSIDGVAELYAVITDPPYRRRGVAASLCSALISRHFQDGGTLVFLDAENDGAVALYRRLGFALVGSRLTYSAPD